MTKSVSQMASKASSSVLCNLSRFLEKLGQQSAALQMLSDALKTNKDKLLQARYLTLLADVDFDQAERMQQELTLPELEEEKGEQDAIQSLIEQAMPEHRKVKKTTNTDLQNVDGGAQIYIPIKRKRKARMPKGFDPENPGPMPDPERWLPKWQQARYKKYARKRGVYLKGAQGDAQMSTDVNKMAGAAASGTVQTASSNNRGNKRRRK